MITSKGRYVAGGVSETGSFLKGSITDTGDFAVGQGSIGIQPVIMGGTALVALPASYAVDLYLCPLGYLRGTVDLPVTASGDLGYVLNCAGTAVAFTDMHKSHLDAPVESWYTPITKGYLYRIPFVDPALKSAANWSTGINVSGTAVVYIAYASGCTSPGINVSGILTSSMTIIVSANNYSGILCSGATVILNYITCTQNTNDGYGMSGSYVYLSNGNHSYNTRDGCRADASSAGNVWSTILNNNSAYGLHVINNSVISAYNSTYSGNTTADSSASTGGLLI